MCGFASHPTTPIGHGQLHRDLKALADGWVTLRAKYGAIGSVVALPLLVHN